MNVTLGGRGTSLLSFHPASTNEMTVKFMKVLPLPGKKGGCEHQTQQKIFKRLFWREVSLFGLLRTQGQVRLLFCWFLLQSSKLSLCIYCPIVSAQNA